MKNCSRCGQEMPDEARYCMRCGQSFAGDVPAVQVETSSAKQGHWEYHTFEKDLGGVSFWLNGWAIDGSGPTDPKFRAVIDDAAKELMAEVAKDGWEPREPVNYRTLWMNHRVDFEAKSGLIRTGTGYKLLRVKLECQRWVVG